MNQQQQQQIKRPTKECLVLLGEEREDGWKGGWIDGDGECLYN